jgi:DNA-binding NtrC family response regulator
MTVPRILLVDDEQAFLDVLTKRLARRNIDVGSATGGREALEMLAADPAIDLVILDVKMPVMDGIETLGEIKRAYPLLPVIILTAHPTVKSSPEWKSLGAVDCLMKPHEMEQLLSAIETARQLGEKAV